MLGIRNSEIWLFDDVSKILVNINEGLLLLKLADTILINTGQSNVYILWNCVGVRLFMQI